MSNVLNHTEMHSDHRQWASEDSLWEDDVHMWQGELDQAAAEIKKLESAFAEHRKSLESHVQAIRDYRASAERHERSLAEYERGEKGEDLIALAQAHAKEAEKQRHRRETHERVKRHHHTMLAHWRLLCKAICKEM
ncbi:MAG TPA: hypothetical protein VHB99_09945 [Pirellulales bacterium]|nr:hypothetical protein [Pirellulales bacterium]